MLHCWDPVAWGHRFIDTAVATALVVIQSQFGLWCQCDWTYNSLAILAIRLWTRSLPRQLTVALHTQWRIVIKGGLTHMGPPMRKREGEKWTSPDVLKGLEKPKERGERRNERKNSKKTRAGRFRKRSKEDPGVLDRDADQES
ncbi:hypothetical protein TNCV_3908901 [Trichonephila clavipes]|nr:hypothetical protein TNCV_3908901 [Trichonephila clavipes]